MAVQSLMSLAGSLPAKALRGNRKDAGSYFPPNISTTTGLNQRNFPSSLVS
jgi:hypothetical protein